jgi:sugar/nucleoside kinase (ribokinase family)
MDAIVVGHICIDLTPGLHGHHPVGAISEVMRPGALVDVAGLTVSPGGAVSNTGLGLARMGMDVGLIARVGADPLAAMLRSQLATAGAGAPAPESTSDGAPAPAGTSDGAPAPDGPPDGTRIPGGTPAPGEASDRTPASDDPPTSGSAPAAPRIELLEDPAAGTSYSVILPVPGLDRIFLHDSGANDNFSVSDFVGGLARLGAGGSEKGAAAPPRLMHFGYPTAVASMYRDGPAPLRDLLAAARARGMTVSVDFSLPDPQGEAAAAPWREILAAAMPLTDVCFPSVEELSLMIDPAGFHERERRGSGAEAFSPEYGYDLAGELLAMGAALVVVKLGGRGLLLRWNPRGEKRLHDTGAIDLVERLPPGGLSAPSGQGGTASQGGTPSQGGTAPPRPIDTAIDALLVPSYPVEKIVAATGAGDTAIAGFLASLLAGGSILDAAETGCVAGRNAVTTVDAVSSARPLTVMNEFRRRATRRSAVAFENESAWQRRTDGAFEHRGAVGAGPDRYETE